MRNKLITLFFVLLLFGSSFGLTVQESIDLALKQNPTVLANKKKVDAADAKFRQAVGTFAPTIKIDGNLGRNYSQPAIFPITVTTTAGSTSQNFIMGVDESADLKGLFASFTQPLFVAGLFPGLKIAQKNADIVREDYRKTVLDTTFNTTKAYYGVLLAKKMYDLSVQSKEMARSHLNQIKALFSAGVSTKADLLRTEVLLANSEVAQTKAMNSFEIAQNTFNNAVGNDLGEKVSVEDIVINTKIPSFPTYDELLNIAFLNRPDWKQFVLSEQMGEENLALARTAYLPSVVLSGKTGNQSTNYSIIKSTVSSWQVAGAASWTLFDGFGIQNKINEAAANLEAQKAGEEATKNAIKLDVRNTYFSLKSALDTIDSNKKAVESAQENYKVSDLRYNSGVGTNLEVMDAQVALTSAQINYAQAIFDLEIAKAKINNVVGAKYFQ
ncbi:MAG: TolC family protein [Candidatus Margulisiibacteriota bacterium]